MQSFPPAAKVVRFGLFELDLGEGELRKNGLKLKLLGQPLQILIILARRPREVVTREELRAELWPTDTFVDFDHGLNNAVQKIREVLGDSAINSRFIETVPRRGYRFLAQVERVSMPAAAQGESVNGTGEGPREELRETNGKEPSEVKSIGNEGTKSGTGGFNFQRIAWVSTVIALAAVIALFSFFQLPKPLPVIHSQIAPPEGTGFSSTLGYNITVPVVSPDGKTLAFATTDQDNKRMIWVRSLGMAEARPLPGTEGGYGPFWSPDNKSIAFFAGSKLKIVGLNNDDPIVVCDALSGARGGSWGIDGTILFAPGPRTPIFRVSAKGGQASAITTLDKTRHSSHRWPFMLPDGNHFLYLAVNFLVPVHDDDGIYYASLDGKENRLLLKAHSNAEYACGYFLFVHDGVLLAQRFEPSKGRLDGKMYQIAEKVAEDGPSWKSVISVSQAGILTYALAEGVHDAQLAWFDRHGQRVGTLGEDLKGQIYRPFRLSPLGDRLALGVDTGITDVWVMALGQRALVRLTFQENSIMPVWSPDGKRIAFLSYTGRWKIAQKASDGAGEEQTLAENAEAIWPLSWSPDGRWLLYARMDKSVYQLWTLPLTGALTPIQVATTGSLASAVFSPDGRWVVYASSESGKAEIYLTPFNRGAGKWQVSRDGGTNPVWATGTNEIFFLAADNTLTTVSVKENAGSLKIGVPNRLFRIPGSGYFDVPAGAEKILVGVSGVPTTRPVHLVMNWSAELK